MRTRPLLTQASWWVGLALTSEDYTRLVVSPDAFTTALEELRKQEQTRAAERVLAVVKLSEPDARLVEQ